MITRMKSVVAFLRHVSVVTAAVLLPGSELRGAVTFSVAPTAVSNSYSGNITLSIAGLNAGETVVVQKFADVNTNSLADAADWLVQQFRLTDGKTSTVGSATNINVPGDIDSTSGTITAKLNLQAGGIEQRLVGRYALVLSSPTNHFGAITNFLNVTNSGHAQSFTGRVLCSGTNVPNATVVIFPGTVGDSSPTAGVIANNSGNYALKPLAGTYGLMALKPGFVSDASFAPTVTLGAGATVTTNLTLVLATRTISGRIVDAANNNMGLGGLFVFCQSANYQMAFSFTDTNGYFTASVTATQWQISVDSEALPTAGYLDLHNRTQVDTTAGNVSGVTIALPKGNALIYGSLKDDQNRPIPGVSLWAGDQIGQYEGGGVTDQNGNYAIAVTGNTWNLGYDDSSPALANYIISQANNLITINAGQAIQQNYTATPAPYRISGYLRDNTSSPVANIGIYAGTTINGTSYGQYTDTDASGYFVLSVANGNWTVGPNCSGGNDSLESQGYKCIDQQLITIANNNTAVNFTVQPCSTLQVTTSSPLPQGIVGTFYYFPLQADGCYQPFNWSLAQGSGPLPPGLTLGPDGTLSGSPGASGTYNFTVHVGNNQGGWAEQATSLTINLPLPPLQITTATLPNGMNGVFYSQQLNATGGQQPYNWWLPFGTSSLPPGTMTLSSGGLLSGEPAAAGSYSFSVAVSDSAVPQNVVTQMLSLTINPSAPVQVMTTWLPNGTNGVPYNQQLNASGGLPPYTWSLMPGSANPPPGLTLGADGRITGMPTVAGGYYFYARVTDASSSTADQLFSITVIGPPLQVTMGSLPNGTLGAPYAAQLTAAGGQPPYTWSLALGSANLPPGLYLSSGGQISGTPTTGGQFNFIVKVTDATMSSVNQPLGIQINSRPTLALPSRLSANQFQFQVNGAASGQNYTVQYSSDLVNWSWLLVTNAPGTSFTVVLGTTNSAGWYRLMVGQ
jgi:Putative Ig domain